MTRRTEWRVAKFDMDRLRHQKTVRNVFIFGDPGTGKTTLVKDILWATWLDVGEDSRVIDEVPHDATTSRADMVRLLKRDASDKERDGTLFVLARAKLPESRPSCASHHGEGPVSVHLPYDGPFRKGVAPRKLR